VGGEGGEVRREGRRERGGLLGGGGRGGIVCVGGVVYAYGALWRGREV
jgi:hypothetical protein